MTINIDYKPTLLETIEWKIKRIVNTFKWKIKQIKFFYQRGKRGWSDYDVWDMDCYLISIILPMLKRLREKSNSFPVNMTEKKWNLILSDMIEAFEAAERMKNDDYYKEVSGDSLEAIKNASKKEIRMWHKLYLKDLKIFEKKAKVFIKYFHHLWD